MLLVDTVKGEVIDDEHLKEKHPEVYELVVKLREKDN